MLKTASTVCLPCGKKQTKSSSTWVLAFADPKNLEVEYNFKIKPCNIQVQLFPDFIPFVSRFLFQWQFKVKINGFALTIFHLDLPFIISRLYYWERQRKPWTLNRHPITLTGDVNVEQNSQQQNTCRFISESLQNKKYKETI